MPSAESYEALPFLNLKSYINYPLLSEIPSEKTKPREKPARYNTPLIHCFGFFARYLRDNMTPRASEGFALSTRGLNGSGIFARTML